VWREKKPTNLEFCTIGNYPSKVKEKEDNEKIGE
jgi:hypothetical protein